MKTNVGSLDRVVRITLGLALLAFALFGEGSLRWLGLVGFIPLVTALAGWCPLYALAGISTCPLAARMR